MRTMTEGEGSHPPQVRGPDGSPLTVEDLPTGDRVRWTPLRKGQVVAAVEGGLVAMAEACSRWGLSVEEYGSWRAAIGAHGLAGLRTTCTQMYREAG